MNKPVIALLALVPLGAALVYFMQPAPTPVAVPVTNVETPLPTKPTPAAIIRTPANTSPPPPVIESTAVKLQAIPSDLDNSDPDVLELIDDLSPTLKQWLIPEQQIRKWILTIDMLAEGEYPHQYQAVNYPMTKFKVTQVATTKAATAEAGAIPLSLASKENRPRMTAIIKGFTAIPASTLADYYQHWYPMLEKAYQEQGKKDQLNQRMDAVIERVLQHKPLADDALLHQPHVFYEYIDKNLENSSRLDKLLWRMGPENAALVQDYVRQLKQALKEKQAQQ